MSILPIANPWATPQSANGSISLSAVAPSVPAAPIDEQAESGLGNGIIHRSLVIAGRFMVSLGKTTQNLGRALWRISGKTKEILKMKPTQTSFTIRSQPIAAIDS